MCHFEMKETKKKIPTKSLEKNKRNICNTNEEFAHRYTNKYAL
jgi:hypothetical protein